MYVVLTRKIAHPYAFEGKGMSEEEVKMSERIIPSLSYLFLLVLERCLLQLS
jgi:hypothetical protein